MQELVNAERSLYGLPPLVLDSTLCELSAVKARDMRDYGYFGHRSERLGSMPQLVSSALGDIAYIGENIGLNFIDDLEAHRAWMTSAMHRKNILGKQYTRIGYSSVATEGSGRIYVQVFAGDTLETEAENH